MYTKKNFGALIDAQYVSNGSLTAGGTGDDTRVTGEAHDRIDFGSVALVIAGEATPAEDATLSIDVEYQESADGTNWDDAETLTEAAVVATGGDSGTTENFVLKINQNLQPLSRYVRYNVNPDLSATGTDTADWACVAVLGGAFEVPV